jgi:hypothetical protein
MIPTIFHEPWWLTAASRGRYQDVKVTKSGRDVGKLPYMLINGPGGRQITMPPLTHFLGPAIDEGEGSETTRFLNRYSITRELIQQLPPVARVSLKLHRGVQDCLPFQALGFRSGVQFTREINPAPSAALWGQMRDKTRNVIRRAQERFEATDLPDPERFMTFYEQNLADRQMKSSYDRQTCIDVISECIRRGQGRILIAMDHRGKFFAGIFTVWDRSVEYYLMSTRRHDSGNGATSLLLWETIQKAAISNRIFDFDGMSQTGDILFFAGFGGSVTPRHMVTKSSLLGSITNLAGQIRHPRKQFSGL